MQFTILRLEERGSPESTTWILRVAYLPKTHGFTLRGSLDRRRTLNYLDAILNLLVVEREKLDEKTKRDCKEVEESY